MIKVVIAAARRQLHRFVRWLGSDDGEVSLIAEVMMGVEPQMPRARREAVQERQRILYRMLCRGTEGVTPGGAQL